MIPMAESRVVMQGLDWEQFRCDPLRDGPGRRVEKMQAFMHQFLDMMKER